MSARILILGRERERKLLEAQLAEGYFDIARAAYGTGALAAVRRARPDIVLLGGDSALQAQFCRALREDSRFAGLPVVLRAETGRGEALVQGADDILPETSDQSLLIARLRSLARGKTRLDELQIHAQAGRRDLTTTEPDENRAGRLALFAAPDSVREMSQKLAASAGEQRPRWGEISRPEEKWFLRDLTPYAQPVRAAARMRSDLLLVELREDIKAGLALCGRLRAAASLRGASLIVLAAPGQESAITRALELGADDYMLTPLAQRELRARLTLHLRRKRLRDALAGGIASTARHAFTDPLTGLHNRRYMLARLPRMMEAASEDTPLSILLIDLDRFKQVNDTYGHDAGDLALRRAAALLRSHLRRGDVLCRLGGEEFIAALPHTGESGAAQLAERLRTALMRESSGAPESLTASFGVSTLASGEKMQDFLKRADAALYRAKRNGRNCVA